MMTPDDVIWSMQALRDANPFYNSYYKNIAKAEQTGEHEVTFTFTQKGNRELPLITGQLPVLSKAWWTAKDAKGKQRNIQETSFEVPLGSGAYVVDDVKLGTSIRMKRVADYWGKDLAVNRGQYNFDHMRYDMYRDENVDLQALLSGDYDFRRALRHLGAGDAHRHAHVRTGQGGRVIDAIARHGHELSQGLQRCDDADFLGRVHARIDGDLLHDRLQACFVKLGQLCPGDDLGAVRRG